MASEAPHWVSEVFPFLRPEPPWLGGGLLQQGSRFRFFLLLKPHDPACVHSTLQFMKDSPLT